MDNEIIKTIIKEAIYDLFGNDVTDIENKKEQDRVKQEKAKERAKKAAETRKLNKQKKEAEFDRNFNIARGYSDLFGHVYTDEEKAEAENYIQHNKKKKTKQP